MSHVLLPAFSLYSGWDSGHTWVRRARYTKFYLWSLDGTNLGQARGTQSMSH